MTACSALDVKKAEQVCLSVLPTFFLLVESGYSVQESVPPPLSCLFPHTILVSLDQT